MATAKNIQNRGLGTGQDMHTCNRCGGLLIREGLFDLFDDTGADAPMGSAVCAVRRYRGPDHP